LLKTITWPVLLTASEVWTLTQNNITIEVAEMCFLLELWSTRKIECWKTNENGTMGEDFD